MNIYLKRRLLVLALGLFILYFCYGLIGGYFRSQALLVRYTLLEARYAALQKTNQELHIRLAGARSDEFIELNARDRLGLVKPGETAYKIVKED